MIRAETIRVGLRELKANALRTVLTTLGIVFGVAAVIAMVSIAEGARLEALQQIESLGTSTVRVKAVKLSGQDLSRARQLGVRGLVLEDAAALARLPRVRSVAPLAIVADQAVRHQERSAAVRIVGTTEEYLAAVSQSVAQGRFLAADDVRASSPVAVLGARAARELLPFRDPLGEEITIGGTAFEVIGVMEDRRQATSKGGLAGAADVARDVHVPVSTARLRFPAKALSSPLDEVVIRVDAGGSVRGVAALARDSLSRRHSGVADFEVVVPEELLRQSQRSQRIFNVVMGAIASISLVVGGIGIMNVMLVTVVQRTREIGVRRAVGATRQDVRDQFLAEALIIAVLGGAAGALLGSALAFGIATFAGWTTIVSPIAVLVALAVAGATGIGFGIFPAIKASRMDPIEALRHE